jgi:hypothetical protein
MWEKIITISLLLLLIISVVCISKKTGCMRTQELCDKGTQELCDKGTQELHQEWYEYFPRCTKSCQPSCNKQESSCSQNPYGQHYEDPRWRNGRFLQPQEWAPGLPGEPIGWIPTANITS